MKKLIFTLFCALSASLAFARISPDSVITAANARSHTPLIGTDKLVMVNIASSSFPSFAAGTNVLWNLNGLVYDTSVHPVVTRFTPDFPYNYADSVHRTIGNIDIYSKSQTLYVLQGLLSGAESVDSQTIIIKKTGAAPDTTVDTLFFKAQGNLYNTTYTKMPFPLVYGSVWHSDFSYALQCLLTDTFRHYTLKPGKILIHRTESDKAIGWGLMKIKEPSGVTSSYAEVVQVKTITYERDSLTLGTTAMPDTLLTLLGLPQGQEMRTYSLNFYRVGRITPMLKLNYADSNLTTLVSAYVDTLNYVPDSVKPASVAFTSLGQDITVYPNPVANHTVNIEVPQAVTGGWSYDIIAISGQVISSGNLPLNGGQTRAQVVLPSSVAPGSYYLHIRNDGAPVCIKTITLIN